jgi:hypothetical protein
MKHGERTLAGLCYKGKPNNWDYKTCSGGEHLAISRLNDKKSAFS